MLMKKLSSRCWPPGSCSGAPLAPPSPLFIAQIPKQYIKSIRGVVRPLCEEICVTSLNIRAIIKCVTCRPQSESQE
jgi:hypothetical protein